MCNSKARWVRLMSAALLVILLALSPRATSAAEVLPELLGSGPALDAAGLNALALRARAASLELGLLQSARQSLAAGETPGPLALSLFDDTRLVARFFRLDLTEGGFTLAGRIDGSPYAQIALSVTGDTLFASLNTHKGLYQIRSSGGGAAEVIQINSSKLPKEAEPLETPPIRAVDSPADPAVGNTTIDDGSRIDVYVGYTDDARIHVGGTTTMINMINTAVVETNLGYSDSLVNQRVHLVGYAEFSYDEGSFNWDTTLTRWTNNGDGYMDTAHTSRDNLRADEMVLVVANEVYCGMGWQMHSDDISPDFRTNGFVLVSQDCLTGYYSFAHEMGHNMGAHHDRYAGGSGAYDYAHGFWILNTANSRYDWRTIMAYNVPEAYGYDSTRVNHWSNPNVNHNGFPTGKPTADAASAYNALVLNNTAWAVAQFKDGSAPSAPTGFNAMASGTNSVVLNWDDMGGTITKYRIERLLSGTWTEIAVVDAPTHTYTDNPVSDREHYGYRVLSDNGNGRTATSVEYFPPNAPTDLSLAVLSVTSVRLTWVDHSHMETEYRIQRAPVGTTTWTTIATVAANVTTVDVVGISTLDDFKYRVVAYNATGGTSLPTSSVNGLPAQPNSMVVSSVSMSRIRITWADSSITETGYRLERNLPDSATPDVWTFIANFPAGSTTYDNVDLPCNTHYGYRVRAYSTVGSSDWITNSGLHTGACAAPPAPTPLVAFPRKTSVHLSWANVDGEDDYEVYRCTDATCGTAYSLGMTGRNITNFDVPELNPSTTYYFGVRSHNAYGATWAKVTTKTMSNEVMLPLVRR